MSDQRAQLDAVDRLALTFGRVAVRDGFADGHLDVTAPGGRCWHINADGVTRQQLPNHSIRWSE